jgi:hypothetical protein
LVEPTLFAESSLVRRWGKIGGAGRTRIDLHASPPLAQIALNTWLERKRRRGYRLRARLPALGSLWGHSFDRAAFATLSPRDTRHPIAKRCLQLLRRNISLLRCGFTPVYALLGRFLPRLKAASGRPPFWR